MLGRSTTESTTAGTTKTPTATIETRDDASGTTQAPGESTTAGPGTRALQALLSGGDGTATAVADLLERHPDERADLLGELQVHLGNGFVGQVLSAQAAPVAGVLPAGAAGARAAAPAPHLATARTHGRPGRSTAWVRRGESASPTSGPRRGSDQGALGAQQSGISEIGSSFQS